MNLVRRIVWCTALGAWVAVSEGRAADRVFDGNGAAAPVVGTGAWNTTAATWFDGAMHRTWNNGAFDRALFALPGAVTIGEPVVAGGLAFNAAGNYTLGGTGTLTLDGARTIALADGANATLSTAFTGGFTLSGNGMLSISRDNTGVYAGNARVERGATLVLGHVRALGTQAQAEALTFADGARLDFGVAATHAFDLTLEGGNVRIAPRSSGGTWSGTPVLHASTELVFGVGANVSQTWSGALRDHGAHRLSLTVDAGEGFGLTLSGANTYGGATRLRNGVLHLANGGALSANSNLVFDGRDDGLASLSLAGPGAWNATLGSGAGQVQWIGSGGFRGTLGTTTVTLDGGAPLRWGAGGFVRDGAALEVGRNVVFANAIDLGNGLRDVFGGGAIAGALTGDGGLRVRGAVLTLSAGNDWRGETHVASRANTPFAAQLHLDHAHALPGGIGVAGGTSALVIDDGLVLLGANSGDFFRGVGTGAHQVRFAGSGGFGSTAGVRTVDLGGAGETLHWNRDGFVPAGASLAFAGSVAGASVRFRNGLDLANGERRIDVAATIAPDNLPHRAVALEGTIANGALVYAGFGEAFVTADNTYAGRTVIGASEAATRLRVLSLADGGRASGVGASSKHAGNLVFGTTHNEYAALVHAGDAASTDRDFTMLGHAELAADGTGALTWTGAPTVVGGSSLDLRLGGRATGMFAGALADGSAALSVTKHGAGTWRLTGENTFTGGVRVGGTAPGVVGSGVLEVESIGDAHVAGNLGINPSNNAARLALFNGAILRYVGAGERTNRNLSRGAQTTSGVADRANGITIESSGTGALEWAGTLQMHPGSNPWLRLGGTNLQDNRVSSVLRNAGQAVSLAKEGSGLWGLSAANLYTGATELIDGVLRIERDDALAGGLGAVDAAGSGIRFDGGILGLTSDLARTLDATAGRNNLAWRGSGGFAAYGDTRTVDLGGTSATHTWGTAHFVRDRLLLSHATADATLVFRNGIDFAGAERNVDVADGAHALDAILDGPLIGEGASGLDKTGAGTLRLRGNAQYAGHTRVRDGVVEIERAGNLGAGAVWIDATLRHVGDATAGVQPLVIGPRGAVLDADGTGAFTLRGDVASEGGALSLQVTAAGHLGGALHGLTLHKRDANTWILSGDSALAALDIAEGTVQVGDHGTTGTLGQARIDNAGTLAFARADRAVFANVVDGPGLIAQRGAGTSVMAGVGSRASRVAVERGTLEIAGALRAPLTETGEATLAVDGVFDAGVLVGTPGMRSVVRLDGGTLIANAHLGDEDDTVEWRGGGLTGVIDGGAATSGDRVVLDTATAIAFDGAGLVQFEHLHKRGAGRATLTQDATWERIAIEGGTLQADARLDANALDIAARATLDMHGHAGVATTVRNAGHIATRARLQVGSDYVADGDARMTVEIAPGAGVVGGLDIEGEVRGRTGVSFVSDGSMGFAPSSMRVVAAPADAAGDGEFFAADAYAGVVRLPGSPFGWTFAHDAAQRGWVLRTDAVAPLMPEFPGYGALPTLAASFADDTHRVLRERMSAMRGDAGTCTPRGDVSVAGDCRGAWMAAFDGTLDVGANPGVAVRGDLHGLLAGSDRVFAAGEGRALRAGIFGGVLRGDHATSGANSTAHPGVAAARLRSTTPVLGFLAGLHDDAGRYLDAQLLAQRNVANVHGADGHGGAMRGTGLSLRVQGGVRSRFRDWWVEPQVDVGVAGQSWGDRTPGVALADDTIAHVRAALRIERDAPRVRPWLALAVSDTRGEAADALTLHAATGEVFGLPNHARGPGAALDVGVDATLAEGLHLHATLSAAEALRGTDATRRQATVGLRWRW